LKIDAKTTPSINYRYCCPKAMPQLSKLIRSRDDWKTKAVKRANGIREHRKTIKRYQKQIAEIKSQLNALQQVAEDNKKNT
jgi:hypothetical protein